MKQPWEALSMTIVLLGLVGGVLGSAYGLALLGLDLLDGGGQWNGIGIVFGLVILSVTLPVTGLSVVLLRLLRRSRPVQDAPAGGALRR